MKIFGRGMDLDEDRQPGEIEYSPLQLTRIERGRKWPRVGLVVCIAAMMAGGVAFVVSSQANDRALRRQNATLKAAIADIEAVRTTSRVGACSDARRFQLAHNALVRSVQSLVKVTFGSYGDPLPQFGAQRTAELERNIVPVRKCDDPSIAIFYESSGNFGCEPSDTNLNGACQ